MTCTGTAAESVRQQVQQDRGASATSSISQRVVVDTAVQVAQGDGTGTITGTTSCTAVARHMHEQLDNAGTCVNTAEDHTDATSSSKYAGRREAHAPARMRESSSFQNRLSPSMPTAPSRHNSTIQREATSTELNFVSSNTLHTALAPSVLLAPSRHNSMVERTQIQPDETDDELRVHFDKYAGPSTFDVPPPATPHPSKGVLNPPQSPRSPVSAGVFNSETSHAHPGSRMVSSMPVQPHLCVTQRSRACIL